MSIASPREANRIPAQVGVSSADGSTPVNPYVDPTDHGWLTNINNVLVKSAYDYVSRSDNGADTVTWVFKSGGPSGTTVATVTIVYTDATFTTIVSVTLT